MSFKTNQRVRIKGTDIEGNYRGSSIAHARGALINDGTGSFSVPVELLEAVIEPITVSFDPVELPVSANSLYSSVSVSRAEETVQLDGQHLAHGLNFVPTEARKLAFAILTITEAGND